MEANDHKQRSNLTGEEQRAQSDAAVFELQAVRRPIEEDQRLAQSAQWTCKWFEGTRLPRWTAAVLVELIGTQISWWIETAAETFERVCPAEIAGRRRERLAALNIWTSIGYCWYFLCPGHNAPVWLFLYEFLKASGLCLPQHWTAAEMARRRAIWAVRDILGCESRYGEAKRRSILLGYPCLFGVMLEFGLLSSDRTEFNTRHCAATPAAKKPA